MSSSPESEAAATRELCAVIRETIEHYGGAMPFDVFMAMALYHQRLGYYAAGRQHIGREGDFYTSVSVGSLFGTLLALQFRQVWQLLDAPRTFWIIEQGANDGQLAADILTTLKADASADLLLGLRYLIVEPFEASETRQRETIRAAGLDRLVSWVPDLGGAAGLARHDAGVFFSNELVDAFPVHLVTFREGRWHEKLVRAEGEGFAWEEQPVPGGTSLDEAIHDRDIPRVEGYTTEIDMGADAWMRQAVRVLERGLWLTIDYGYPRPHYYSRERHAGTLRTYRQHRRDDDPLAAPGQTDITAHVDFTTLARAGEHTGLNTLGFVDQHHFIMGLCADAFSRNHFPGARRPPTPAEARAFKTLSHPEMMGTSFHVLAQGCGLPQRPPLDGLRFARPVEGLL